MLTGGGTTELPAMAGGSWLGLKEGLSHGQAVGRALGGACHPRGCVQVLEAGAGWIGIAERPRGLRRLGRLGRARARQLGTGWQVGKGVQADGDGGGVACCRGDGNVVV